jgi:hypothetical protein
MGGFPWAPSLRYMATRISWNEPCALRAIVRGSGLCSGYAVLLGGYDKLTLTSLRHARKGI